VHLLERGDHALPVPQQAAAASPAQCSTAIDDAIMRFIEVPRVEYKKLRDSRLEEK